jgi:hypothetical protein
VGRERSEAVRVEELGFFIYMWIDGFVGRAAIGPVKFVPCLGPARRAGVAAQALKGHRAGPTLSPIDRA